MSKSAAAAANPRNERRSATAEDSPSAAYLHPMIQEHLLAERAIERSRNEKKHQQQMTKPSKIVSKTTKFIGNERHEISTVIHTDGRKVTTTRVFAKEGPAAATEITLPERISDVDPRHFHPSIQEDILARANLEKQQRHKRQQEDHQAPSESSAEFSPKTTPTINTPQLLHPFLQEHYLAEQALQEQEEIRKEDVALAKARKKEQEKPGALHPLLQEHYLALAELPKTRTTGIAQSPSAPLLEGYQADSVLGRRQTSQEHKQQQQQPASGDNGKKVKKKGGWSMRHLKKGKQGSSSRQVARGLPRIREKEQKGKAGKDKKEKSKRKKSSFFGGSNKNKETAPAAAQASTRTDAELQSSAAWKSVEAQPRIQPLLIEKHVREREVAMIHAAAEGRPKPDADEFFRMHDATLNSIASQQQQHSIMPRKDARRASVARPTPSPSMQMSGYQRTKNTGSHALVAAPNSQLPLQHPNKGQGWEHIITDDIPGKSKEMKEAQQQQQEDYCRDSYSGSRSTLSDYSSEKLGDYERPPITEHVVRHDSAVSEVTNPWELRSDQIDGYDSDKRSELSYDSMDYVEDDQWEALEKAMKRGGPEATRQWEKFLKRQGAQDCDGQDSSSSKERQQITSQQVSEAPSESTSTGLQTSFICACCNGSRRTKESGNSCDNVQSPHLVCSDCIREFLWSAKDTHAPYAMLGSHDQPICQLPCFTSSSQHCPFKIHVRLRNLFEPKEMEHWVFKENKMIQQQQQYPSTPVSSSKPKSCVRNSPTSSPKQKIQVAMKEAATKAQVRICSTCKESLNKNQNGCNAMKCPCCNTISCYVCRHVVASHQYDAHFDMCGDDSSKCPLLTDAETDRKREEEDMKRDIMALANQALDDYKHNH